MRISIIFIRPNDLWRRTMPWSHKFAGANSIATVRETRIFARWRTALISTNGQVGSRGATAKWRPLVFRIHDSRRQLLPLHVASTSKRSFPVRASRTTGSPPRAGRDSVERVVVFFATLINQTLQTEPVVMLEQNAFLGHVRLVTALEFKIGEYDYSVALSSITARKSSGRATRCGIAMARWTRRLTLRPDGSIHLCAKR